MSTEGEESMKPKTMQELIEAVRVARVVVEEMKARIVRASADRDDAITKGHAAADALVKARCELLDLIEGPVGPTPLDMALR